MNQTKLSNIERAALLELYKQYYDNVKAEFFYKDLDEKQWVILMEGEEGVVYGFSTLQTIALSIKNSEHIYLYSGDTIMKEEVRNSPVLACAFINFMYALIKKYPNIPLHWFLISKGYRTYRFLQVYFKEFYPVYDKIIPINTKEVLDAIGKYKFGEEYDPDTQIIHHKQQKDCLKAEFAQIPEGKLKNPHIKFFAETNKNYQKGDELACITDIAIENFNPLVEKIKNYAKVEF